jgi:uncharacterized protein involved in response to NO
MAMMMRTTLSHTGRARRSGIATLIALLFINVAALLRVATASASALAGGLLVGSMLLWSSAFFLFIIVYGPMLATRQGIRPER